MLLNQNASKFNSDSVCAKNICIHVPSLFGAHFLLALTQSETYIHSGLLKRLLEFHIWSEMRVYVTFAKHKHHRYKQNTSTYELAIAKKPLHAIRDSQNEHQLI